MECISANSEQSPVYLGVQGLDASVQAFGCLCVVGHVCHVQTGIAQRLGRSASREEVNVVGGQECGKFDNASLVRDGNESASDGDNVCRRTLN
jgi:hypothetical protein